MISAWPQGVTGAGNQEFRPEVVVQTSGFSLNCGQDYLQNRDGNLYGAHPIQGCTALGGNRYKIAFGTPLRAPAEAGEYHSRWQIWRYPNHIGPQIDLWFRVAKAPDNGRPPTNPVLRSPHDWHVARDGRAPELCWNPSTDPDGEAVRYFVEVRGARIADSDWISQTCWRPGSLDGHYFGYSWRVKAMDARGIQSGWSDSWRFNIDPAPNTTPVPTSTPPAATQPPSTEGSWWHPDWMYRRVLPITTDGPLSAGMLIKVDGFDLETLVASGKARADHNDIRVVRRSADSAWQEVARAYYTGWDLEFRLLADIPPGTDTSYYLYYGNPGAGAPPTFSLPQGWWVDMYIDKWWESYHSTWAFNQTMDFNDICGAPVSHRDRTGSSFDDSDKYRGRLFIPTTGNWTFRLYNADGYRMYLDGAEIGRFDGYDSNRWVSMGPTFLKAGWYSMDLRDMWVNCAAWKFAMEGPGFANQIVPAHHFQQVWGNIKTGIGAGSEQTRPSLTPTPITTATPGAGFSMFGDGRNGDLLVPSGQEIVINQVRTPVTASGMTAVPANPNGFSIGDLILIHQTQGTANAGRWEVNRIAAQPSPTNWTLQWPLANAYDSAQGRAQVILIPQYRTVTIQSGGILTAPAWDGTTGGVMAFRVKDQLTSLGTIRMSGLNGSDNVAPDNSGGGMGGGFRGGNSTYLPGQPTVPGFQGEGINGPGGRQSTQNMNGGGGACPCGPRGAGGGNGAPGENTQWDASTAYGGNTAGLPDLSVLGLGGGGGGGARSGDPNDPASRGAGGGSGGGAILIYARTIDMSGGAVSATGGRGGVTNFDTVDQPAFAGGGGAGGSILIKSVNATLGVNQISAVGGAGGAGGFHGAAGREELGGFASSIAARYQAPPVRERAPR